MKAMRETAIKLLEKAVHECKHPQQYEYIIGLEDMALSLGLITPEEKYTFTGNALENWGKAADEAIKKAREEREQAGG